MRSRQGDQRWRASGAMAAGFVLAFLASGCSSTDGLFGSSSAPSSSAPAPSVSGNRTSFTDRITSFFRGESAKPGEGTLSASGPQQGIDCPGIEIREGASTYSVTTGGDANVTNVRYQASIVQTARECAVLGATMTIKVGVQGRLLLGPAGGPGQVEIPLRLAVVQEGVEPKTIWTKLYRIPVMVSQEQVSVPFVQIEEDATFPVPKPSELEAFVVYIGFDASAAKEPAEKNKPQKKPHGKPQASR